MLKRYCHVDDGDDARTMGQGDRPGADARRDPPGHPPGAVILLDVLPDDSPFRTLDPPQRRQRTLQALKRVLLRESQVQPLLLVFEDLHWIDAETQALLDSLVESLPTARLLLLVNYRPEYQHGWSSKTSYTQLRLDPPPPASADALLQALLGDDGGAACCAPTAPQAAFDYAHRGQSLLPGGERAHLVETGVLVGEPGAYRLAQALPTIQMPATVQAVLAARIDRLPPEEKRLLQTAAVVGTEVPLPLLQAIAEGPEATLHRGLVHLQAAEFLYETRLFPEPEYTFKHALTHEVAGGCCRARGECCTGALSRPWKHSRPSGWPSRSNAWRTSALRGEVGQGCALLPAGRCQANDRAAFREAVAYFDQALQALAHLPEPGDTRMLALEIRLAVASRCASLGEYGRQLALLGEAEALARALDDRARLGRVLATMATALRLTGDPDGAIATGRQALELAAALGDSALQGQASCDLGKIYYALGDFGRAAELLRWNVEAVDRVSGTPSTDVRIESRAWLARTLSAFGAFAEGRRHGEEALRLATMEGRGQTPIVAHGCLGQLYLAQGDLEHAIRVLEQGLALCRASGDRNWFARDRGGSGLWPMRSRGASRRGACLWRRRSAKVSARARWDIVPAGSYGSARSASGGRGEEAGQHARQALDLARQQKERGHEALALHQLGAVQTHASPRCRAGRSPLPAGLDPGRGARHAPTRGPLPPRPGPAIRPDRP